MEIKNYVLSNEYWKLEIHEKEPGKFIYKLCDCVHDVIYSDQDYHYSLMTSKKKGMRYQYLDYFEKEKGARHLENRTVRLVGGTQLIIEGYFSNTKIKITHVFTLEKGDKWLKESITLLNEGEKKVRFSLINLGFEKMLFKQREGWQDHLDEYTLTAIPSRRFYGYGEDRRKEFFSANDLLFNEWVVKEARMPGFCAEGWAWGNDKGGLLTCKYNVNEIEFSRFSNFRRNLPGRGVENVSIIFGGASLYNGDPERATELNPKESYAFGISKYAAYEGDFKEAYYLYRSHLEQNGHRFKKDYNPPVHWNELYNLGWEAEKTGFFVKGEKFEKYTLEQLYQEAKLAREVGAEALYLDPGWDTYLGSEIWNEERFGPLSEFSRTIHEKYGLKLALHLMMNFGSDDEEDYFYLKSPKGVRVVADPYINLYCVCANEQWVKEKTRRLLELARNEIDFFMFDFTDFSSFMIDNIGCCDKTHGHEVPMHRQSHAEGIFKVIQNVKKHFPQILIEAHGRGVNHPLYYQHGLPYSFDENWGFECMWNPLQDLLSHKAFQLYEYNLAYSIPLYLHINENSDNEEMLQFWWYASVVRHLGVGGLKEPTSRKFIALKNAMILYKKIKRILTQGTFYGIDPTAHFHLSPNKKQAITIAVNLTSRAILKKIILNPTPLELDFHSMTIKDGTNNLIEEIIITPKLKAINEFLLEIHPLSPRIIIFN